MRSGRPLKGKSRRIPITIHASIDMIDAIDEYVSKRAKNSGRVYSRSDFYEEAAAAYLRANKVDMLRSTGENVTKA